MSQAEATSVAARVRRDFPLLERVIDDHPVVYLDSAATALKPKQVVTAMVEYLTEQTANIHRGKHYLSEEASTRYEEARYKVAQLIGAFGNEVVFVRNTTEAINVIAQGLKLGPDDLVVTTLDAHHSNILPWRRTSKIAYTRVSPEGLVDLDHYAELLRQGPKVAALTHCSNVTGVYSPLEQMVTMAKEAGVTTVVDAAQGVPHRRIDVSSLPCDFLAFSSHKMLGPSGVGTLYGRRERLEALGAVLHGGGMVDWVDEEGFRVRKIPHRLEAGTPNIEGAFGYAAAVSYLERIGFDALRAHDKAMADLMLEKALERPYMKILGPRSTSVDRAAILSFAMVGHEKVSDIARMLSDSYGIMCRSGHLCAQPLVDHFTEGEVLRASAYVYNGPEDILHLFQALDEIRERLGRQ